MVFAKGNVPWNKGLKGWTKGTKAGFQKGSKNPMKNKSIREKATKKFKETYKQRLVKFKPWNKGLTKETNERVKKYAEDKVRIEKIRKSTVNQLMDGRMPQTNTKIEIIMKEELLKHNILFEHPYNFKNKFACDFAIPSKKIIIECDGDYWHNLKETKMRDKSKDAYIARCGWKVLRFWEKDIKNDIKNCITTIKKEMTLDKVQTKK